MINHKIAYNNDLPWVFRVKRALGEFIWDHQDKQYIDFTSGWNVANLGFNHPEISAAVIEQVHANHYAPMWTSESIQEQYAEELTKVLPSALNTICRASSGTEANEMAIKIARAATGRKTMIGFTNAYHGQSLATLALSFPDKTVEKIGPLPSGFLQLQFPSINRINEDVTALLSQFYRNLESILARQEVAAIVLEACMVTGSGFAYVTEGSFLQEVRRLTHQYGTLMILDEIGTGFSRCGALFAHELYQVEPDILTLAKAISNGVAAMGAVVVNDALLEPTLPYINITSTFGWTPIACAAASAVLKIHVRDKVFSEAKIKGQWLLDRLRQELGDHPKVSNIQGIGLEVGVTFVNNRTALAADPNFTFKVVSNAREHGLHLTSCNQSVIQIMPPLTIQESVLQEGLAIFIKSIQ